MKNDPTTGRACTCKRGVERNNFPRCEGTGREIDFRAIHAARAARQRSPYMVLPSGRVLTEEEARECGLHLDEMPLGEVTDRQLGELFAERTRAAELKYSKRK